MNTAEIASRYPLFDVIIDQDHPLACLRIAVLIPCLDEEKSIARVVRNFGTILPTAGIYVYDNASLDRTAEIAAMAGATVRSEALRGKGHVVCRMFAEIEADIYILVDGDGSHDANSAGRLVQLLVAEQLDMLCAVRNNEATAASDRFGHRFGNRLLTSLVGTIFNRPVRDMLTGYRVLSRRYVKSFPALSEGFEIETQLTVHALELRVRFGEVDVPYFERQAGSESKLDTVRDGWRICRTIIYLLKEGRPLAFFSMISALLVMTSLVLALPILIEFMETSLVPRFPTAILATGVMILAFLSLASGLILDSVSNGRRELKRLHYLAIPPLPVPHPHASHSKDHSL